MSSDAHVDTISLRTLCFSHAFIEVPTHGGSYFSAAFIWL